jgi:hypothetical protein
MSRTAQRSRHRDPLQRRLVRHPSRAAGVQAGGLAALLAVPGDRPLQAAQEARMYFPNNKLDTSRAARRRCQGRTLRDAPLDGMPYRVPREDPNRQKRVGIDAPSTTRATSPSPRTFTRDPGMVARHPNMGLYVDDPGDGIVRCGVCQGTDLRYEGFTVTRRPASSRSSSAATAASGARRRSPRR